MKALKCITLGNTIGMMTDTVVRIEVVRYGLLEFATLVVHNTQGIAADSFNNARPCWRKGVSIMLAGLVC